MCIVVVKAWLRRRWHVYSIGHNEGDHTWLASFCSEERAHEWADHITGVPRQPQFKAVV